MNTETLQSQTDEFNRKYFKACESSEPEDWLKAALAGRHLVNILVSRMDINDILPELQKNVK